jgi:hypothetical protein
MSISVGYARKNAQLLSVHLLRDEIAVPDPDPDPAKEAERLRKRVDTMVVDWNKRGWLGTNTHHVLFRRHRAPMSYCSCA